jgi:adenylate cyclase
VGVLLVGLLTRQLDRAVQIQIAPEGTADPHRIFLCDTDGRLVTRLSPGDRLAEMGDNLRMTSNALPPEVQRALSDPALHSVSEGSPLVSSHFPLGGEEFLTTFRPLPETQDWMVGIVVPRSFYLGKLAGMRDRMLLVSLGIMLLLVVSGAVVLRAVKRAHARITHESAKMNRFDFSPAPAASPFRDVGVVLDSLENAKTAMRAMGKYVPVDLVRRLYRDRNEPVLGGEAMEISIMFTDIKDFTSMSETLDPDLLARALGRYLETMARIIQQETHGTIDKYIGDAIMTIWNAPAPVAGHARMACTAALRCRDAARNLAASPGWEGLPPFETRFGLHAGTATVGHFGAPDRMNYTAIGDSVNLASRLEGLNKQYGTSIIASESIVEATRDLFAFRRLDRVAVKGRNRAITIYELLGPGEEVSARQDAVHRYERALDFYAAGDFASAVEILGRCDDDPSAAFLAARCRAFIKEPPPPGWDGVAVMTTK